MHNTIRITLLMLFLPVMASAQFYTITKGKDIIPIPDDKSLLYIDNKVKQILIQSKQPTQTRLRQNRKNIATIVPVPKNVTIARLQNQSPQRAVQTFQN